MRGRFTVSLLAFVGCAGTQHREELSRTRAEIQRLAEQVEALQKTVSGVRSSAANISSRVDGLRNRAQEIERGIERRRDEFEEAARGVAESTKRTEARIGELSERADTAIAKVDELLKEIRSITSVEKVSAEIAALLGKKGAVDALVADITERWGELVKDRARIMQAVCSSPEWRALHFTALHAGRDGLTEFFTSDRMTCYSMFGSFKFIVGLDAQPRANPLYLGDGRWKLSDRELRAKLREAVDGIISVAKIYRVTPVMEINFFFRGRDCATWKNGKIYLSGDEVPNK